MRQGKLAFKQDTRAQAAGSAGVGWEPMPRT
jgi:hypothetical protein